MNKTELVRQAAAMRTRAYAPYSGFRVGAALLCKDGTVYTGCNVENAAFGVGLCAERVALGKAVSEGKTAFTHLAVVGSGGAFCVPCGICRQMLWEFAPALSVLCANEQGQCEEHALQELLPFAFGDFRNA